MERIKERSFGKYIIFSILTLGIYKFYFYYCLGRDINTLCEGDGQESPNYVVATIVGGATLGLYMKYWIYQQGQRLHVNAPRFDYKMLQTGWDVLAMSIIPFAGIFSSLVLIQNVNKMAEAYNSSVMV